MVPSEVIEAHIAYQGRQVRVKIPRNETFLVSDIFEKQEYALPNWYRPAGPSQVWDVGANIGLFALYMKLRFAQSMIYSYEPVENLATLFQANAGFMPGVHFFPYGLFNRDQEAVIHLHAIRSAQHSIRPLQDDEQGQAIIQLRDAGGEWDRLALERLDVLKVDTEGCEVEILESLGNRLEAVDIVLIEYHSEQDRRRIDQLLLHFHLYGLQTPLLGLGTARYVHQRLLSPG